VVELDLVGSGFIVVKRRVVEGILNFLRDKVYPSIPDEYRWLSAVPYFPATYDPNLNAIMSSDFSFCRMAKQAMDAKIVIDCGIICDHMHEGPFNITTHWEWIQKHEQWSEFHDYCMAQVYHSWDCIPIDIHTILPLPENIVSPRALAEAMVEFFKEAK